MYGYGDYYDERLTQIPYTDSSEELEDYRALVEIMLEDLAGIKGVGTEEGLFSKGLVISEAEMQEYFVNHPSVREKDFYFYILGDVVKQAIGHIESREESTSDNVFLPIRNIRKNFGLSDAWTVALVLAFLAHTNRGYERIYGFLQDDIESSEPTLGLAVSLCERAFYEDKLSASDILSDKSYLFGTLFMEEGINPVYPLRTKLILTGAALTYMNGNTTLFGYGAGIPYGLLCEYEDGKTPAFFEKEVKVLFNLIRHGDALPCLFVEGRDQDAIIHVAALAARANGKRFVTVSGESISTADEMECSGMVAFLSFYGHMEGITVMVTDVTDERLADESFTRILKRLIRTEGIAPFLFAGSDQTPERFKTGAATGTPVLHLQLPVPDVKVRTTIWDYFIKDAGLSKEKGFSSEEIADCYEVGYGVIKTAVSQAKLNMLANGVKKVNKDIVADALKGIGTVNFKGLAKEVRAVYTWEDLCIGDTERRVLQTACDRYKIKNRIGENWGITKKNAYGNGVSVLLYGPPGTGKTMSAQVVAREIGLPLYRVDTSQLFSKYIGETQKNLNAVFDEAEASNVILFFDEADALFSKRTDVESSNDRHANQEIAFLLQRIEEYKGMSLLATNFYSGFDQAFVRRITYAVRLEQPDYETRLSLWNNTLPEEVPKEKSIDYEFLAKNFELTGSNIKAILLSAAYMAGAEDGMLSMAHIVRAMKYEFDKLGMMPDSGKFGPYSVYLFG